MKNITKESLRDDLKLITELFEKYSGAIYEAQEGQPAHYDNQPKLIKLTIGDIRCGLYITREALFKLNEINNNLIED